MPERTLPFDFTAGDVAAAPPEPRPAAGPPPPLSVGELDRALRQSIEATFGSAPLWVEGEVTGTRGASSGHLYFTLKDEREDAAIDVVIYRTNVSARARTLIVDGARLRVRGRPTFWAPRGRVQFVGDRVLPGGKGALLEALERLKEQLQAEGLFAAERKRPLPRAPRTIGVVTSASGAVIHDVCRVAFQRGGAQILLAPAVVQGPGAGLSIRRALWALQRVPDVDVVIVGRGGGSADDLSAFNDEAVVRAVAKCRVPVVSAVGHEVDVTLTDFVADVRAATPSQAAEMVVPDSAARREHLRQQTARLLRAMRGRVDAERVRVGRVERRLQDPRLVITEYKRLVEDRARRLAIAGRSVVHQHAAGLRAEERRLAQQDPRAALARQGSAVAALAGRLEAQGRALVVHRRGAIAEACARLDALSPLKVLGRGYAIALREDGRAVRSERDAAPGDRLVVRVEEARLEALVTSVERVR